MRVEAIRDTLAALGNPADAAVLGRFFQTGPGGYGAGDRFRGVRVPQLRRLAREHRGLSTGEARELLASPFHEDRLLALLILAGRFTRGDEALRREIYDLYLAHTRYVNGWDLVDASAEHIVGAFLWDRDPEPLHRLAGSAILWERRIAVMATFHFIKRGRFDLTFALAGRLLEDREDLIHKAVGWMLREIGKRDPAAERVFLAGHYRRMPRTMLRYAIERFPEPERQAYLKGTAQHSGAFTPPDPDAHGAREPDPEAAARPERIPAARDEPTVNL